MSRGEITHGTSQRATNGAVHDEIPGDHADLGDAEMQTANGYDGDAAPADDSSADVAADEMPAADDSAAASDAASAAVADTDPAETQEWLESLQYVLESKGPERVSYLLSVLDEKAHRSGVELPFSATTPYINTIPADDQPPFPGNREIERRIKSIIRWNAMAMVVRANKESHGHRRPYFDLCLGRDALRSRLQSFLPRQGGRFLRGPDLFSGACLAWNLCPSFSRRAAERRAACEFPPRVGPRRRPFVVSASLVDA